MGRANLRKLGSKKYRQQFQLYTLEGLHAVGDAFRSGVRIFGILHTAKAVHSSQDNELLKRVRKAGLPVDEISEADAKAITGLVNPPGMTALLPMPDTSRFPSAIQEGVTLVLDHVNDPGNAGTLLRAAAFYGVKQVWLSEGSVDPFNQKVLRAAMAAHLVLDIRYPIHLEPALKLAHTQGATVAISLLEGGKPPQRLDKAEKKILILGNEPQGIDPALLRYANERLAIPRQGPVDSLNVAMAGAVLLDRLIRE